MRVPRPGEDRTAYRKWLLKVSRTLVEAQREVRILKSLTWPDGTRRRFFARKARELPRASYAELGYDSRRKSARMKEIAEALDPTDPLQGILAETALQYVDVIAMLRARGKREFYDFSRRLYGHPLEPFAGQTLTELDLARHLDRLLGPLKDKDLVARPRMALTAEEAARLLRKRMRRAFPGAAVKVEVSRNITADAAAGAARIRIKRGRMFTRDTVAYLEQHEGYVHIATTLNGRLQRWVPILGKASPRATRVNEGLAVFGEWASHTITVLRLRRLVDRVLAIRMAEEGADFLQVYRAFLDRGEDEVAAFDIARRVFRGADLRGGAPFTKDAAYLGDFLRLFNFARVAVKKHRLDLLDLMFLGKVTIPDLPILVAHVRDGDLVAPRYLPPWAKNKNWLVTHMSLSSFLNVIHLPSVEAYYEDLFARC